METCNTGRPFLFLFLFFFWTVTSPKTASLPLGGDRLTCWLSQELGMAESQGRLFIGRPGSNQVLKETCLEAMALSCVSRCDTPAIESQSNSNENSTANPIGLHSQNHPDLLFSFLWEINSQGLRGWQMQLFTPH